MTAAAIFFYLFASVTVASGFMVIASRNPVASVLFLILAFVNAAGLFVLMGAEFLAMILVVVYVGAVAVLFLFVVMMLDVDFAELRQGFQQYLPVGALIGAIFLVELLLVVGSWTIDPGLVQAPLGNVASAENLTNAQALGRVLYTDYAYFFQLAGLILLVAMIGAIVLTLRDRPGVKRQNIAVQNARTQTMAVETRKVPSRRGRASRSDAGSDARSDARRRTRTMIGLSHYLTVAAILFTLGVLGIFINRKNIIVILMSVELILLSVNINLVAFSTQLNDITGQVFALFVLTVAAAESAIGLAILVVFFRNRGSIAVEDVSMMKG